MSATKCRDSGGPYRLDSRSCLARPTRSSKPTKEQLKPYRKASDREYQVVVRANAAKARAASAENLNGVNRTPDCCQISNISVDNSNLALVVTTIGVEILL